MAIAELECIGRFPKFHHEKNEINKMSNCVSYMWWAIKVRHSLIILTLIIILFHSII